MLDKTCKVMESKTNGLIWKQQVINEIMGIIDELRTEGGSENEQGES